MGDVKDFLSVIAILLLFGSPFVLLAGLIITIANKSKRKLGLYLIIGAVISFIIGFGICLNTFSISGH